MLFVELSKSLDRQPEEVKHTIKWLRIALVGLWGVYPIAYLFPVLGGDFFGGEGGFVLKQAGYSLADILAKAAYGLAIYKVARVKSRLEDPDYDDHPDQVHGGHEVIDSDELVGATRNGRAARTTRES